MTDVYQRLATHLDALPAGFPPTESGVELRILKRLFTPDEAETALHLTLLPETAKEIAARINEDPEALEHQLDAMSRRGLIFRSGKSGYNRYGAAQFIVGIWEYHVNDLDEELIRDVNEYTPHIMRKAWLPVKTKQLRVIPISQSISAGMELLPYEKAEEIIRQQSHIVVAPCICRREHAMVGDGCGKLEEACLIFGGGAYYYEENGLGRPITQEAALEILETGKEQGLVLQPGNARKPTNLCMCCGCCCQVLKNLKFLEAPAKAIGANWLARVDADRCTACGTCEERCQMQAIHMEEVACVNADRCIGCGLCVITCNDDAVSLVQKPEAERQTPPKTVPEAYLQMAMERQGKEG